MCALQVRQAALTTRRHRYIKLVQREMTKAEIQIKLIGTGADRLVDKCVHRGGARRRTALAGAAWSHGASACAASS